LENSEKYTPKKLASYIYQFFQAAWKQFNFYFLTKTLSILSSIFKMKCNAIPELKNH
jgi:hypothetical protein